jgi:abequosyltransferase
LQLGWIYTAIEHHRRSLFIRDPLVAALANNTGGYGLFKVFGPTLKSITEGWLSSEKLRRLIINGTLQTFFPAFLLHAKCPGGAFDSEDPHAVLRSSFHQNFRYWFFDFPVSAMPAPLDRAWILVGRVVNKFDVLIGHRIMR